ncbi:unnamed protein product [Cuscuta campestris]|uniref:Uncharacterized protein n=1 Tax=Cuscuta campestris TaxID=132261 RepID=A0A484K2H9_9ASTE|nr:unnamed protein product [Cuscuta campestris]
MSSDWRRCTRRRRMAAVQRETAAGSSAIGWKLRRRRLSIPARAKQRRPAFGDVLRLAWRRCKSAAAMSDRRWLTAVSDGGWRRRKQRRRCNSAAAMSDRRWLTAASDGALACATPGSDNWLRRTSGGYSNCTAAIGAGAARLPAASDEEE